MKPEPNPRDYSQGVEITECIYCNHEVPNTDPKEMEESNWAEVARYHRPDCEWISTRAHTRSEVIEYR